MSDAKDLLNLIKEGRIDEARALIEAEKVKAKYAPDTLTAVKCKPPRFTKGGKPVELGEDGSWRVKPKAATPRKG